MAGEHASPTGARSFALGRYNDGVPDATFGNGGFVTTSIGTDASAYGVAIFPAGTANGRTFRIRGKGAPRPRKGGSGDLLATIRVEVPAKLSREQKDLLKQLQAVEGESPRRRLGVEA